MGKADNEEKDRFEKEEFLNEIISDEESKK
jgi:hypothetical protein